MVGIGFLRIVLVELIGMKFRSASAIPVKQRSFQSILIVMDLRMECNGGSFDELAFLMQVVLGS